MKHQGTKTIETARLRLRPFQTEDIPAAYHNWMSDEQVTAFLRWQTHSDIQVSEQVIQSWIQSYCKADFYQWAIALKHSDEPIGSISVVELNERTNMVHIGYCIGSRWWHQGYTSEALHALIAFFFEEVQANRIESMHDPENVHSGNVMKKCGMRFEGTLAQADYSNRGIVDASVYSILASDYFK